MTAAAAPARAYTAVRTLVADGERLRWRGPQPPPDLLADMRAHKAEVMIMLSAGKGIGTIGGIRRSDRRSLPMPPMHPVPMATATQAPRMLRRAAMAQPREPGNPMPRMTRTVRTQIPRPNLGRKKPGRPAGVRGYERG